jgi:hypothetical protein
MYSRAPEGFHDEPFEYVFSFYNNFGTNFTTASQADFLDQPLEFDPDADFYVRSIAQMVDPSPTGEGLPDAIYFNMRLRDAFGRPLDSGFIPIGAYAIGATAYDSTLLTPAGIFPPPAGGPLATPWYPELLCPRSCVMFADFQAENIGGQYSFRIYFQGVKRFKNEECGK